MVCRHGANDPDCSSNRARLGYEYESSSSATTPDASRYQIEDVARVGAHLVMKVKYPNCALCSYEGNKVLVFLNVTEIQVLRWKRIDPHFRSGMNLATDAPSPAARFPASPEGWADALEYVRRKDPYVSRG